MSNSGDDKAVWFGYYTSQINTSIQLSKDYAHLAVQSLIGMNAGALLAIPPIVEVFFKGSLTFEQAVVPMVLFLLGLIAAVLTSYAAYFNFQYLAQSYSMELWKRVIDLDEKADAATFHRLKRWRATTRADYDKQERRYDLLSSICFYAANSLGIASLCCFVSGALLFASRAIPPS